jgi:hypothetical protein
MSTTRRLPAALLVLALGAAACSAGGASPQTGATGSPAPSTAPGSPPAASPETPSTAPSLPADGIVHPTGAAEIVLRYETAGGFTPPEWQAARLPSFTLYGDGRIVFIHTATPQPERTDNVFVGMPVRTVQFSEEQVQPLLLHALNDGGLAIARESYDNPMVADAPSTIFTINADNDTKTVNAMALGMENQPGPDTAILAKLAALAELLGNFDGGRLESSQPYVATAYRGVILEQQGLQGVKIADWPWADLKPSDFKLPADANSLQQGTAILTPEQAAAVGVEPYENGISSGVFVKASDGKVFSLVIRPLLPDEKA